MELSLRAAVRHYRRLLAFAIMGDKTLEKQKVIEVVYKSISSDISNVFQAMSVLDEMRDTEFVFDTTIPEAVSFVHLMVQLVLKVEIPLEYENLLYLDFEQIKQGLKIIEERAYEFNPHTVHVTYN